MKKLGLIIPQDYKLLSIAAILDVLENVNKISLNDIGSAFFDIHLIRTSELLKKGGCQFHGYALESTKAELKLDIVFIPSFTTDHMQETLEYNRKFIPWIQQQYQLGAEVASFCTGAFLFGATGLLDGKAATTHQDACMRFASLFPKVRVKPDQVVVMDGCFYTSGGSTSTFHLLLRIIQKYCGEEMAVRIAKVFSIDMDRYKQNYFGTFTPSRFHQDDLVRRLQDKIEKGYHEIGTIDEVMKQLPSSRRNMVRRFKQATGLPPIEYLQHIRVENAKKKLEQTNHSINEIIDLSGYTDPKSFRKVFQRIVGLSPVAYREKFRMG